MRLVMAILAAILGAVGYASAAEPATGSVVDKLRYYQALQNSRFAGWDARGDGVFLITGADEGPQVFWRGAPNDELQRVTHLAGVVIEASPSPVNPALIAVLSDDNGDERRLITIHERGSDMVMTAAADVIGGDLVWSPEGDRLAWVAVTQGDRRGVFMASIDSESGVGKTMSVFEATGDWRLLDWSPDGAVLLLKRVESASSSRLYEYELAAKTLTPVDAKSPAGAYGAALFNRHGDKIYFSSNAKGETLRLVQYDREKQKRKVLSNRLDGDVALIAPAPDGRSIAFTSSRPDGDDLYFMNARGRIRPALNGPPGRFTALKFDRKEKELGFSISVASAPEEVYSFRIQPQESPLKRWTFARAAGVDPGKFLDPISVNFLSAAADQKRINALVYHRRSNALAPVIISFHGGPEGAARPTFDHEFQFWANELGATVILPNIRGSVGYGKSFEQLDNGRLRPTSFGDVDGLLRWISQQEELDPSRVVVHGASYGGYLAMMSLARFGDRLAGGISLHGVTDIGSFLAETAEYRRASRRREYGDERDPAVRSVMDAISPLREAYSIKDPVLIIHGANDPRVPVSQADRFVEALKAANAPVIYLRSDTDGHGFSDIDSRLGAEAQTAMFLDEIFSLETSEKKGASAEAPL